jgi:hypothetical protein
MRAVTRDDFAVNWLRRRVSGRRVTAQYFGAREGTWFIGLGCAGVLREDISPRARRSSTACAATKQRSWRPRLWRPASEHCDRGLRKSQTAGGGRQRPEQSGRIERTGLRMMPTFPRSPRRVFPSTAGRLAIRLIWRCGSNTEAASVLNLFCAAENLVTIAESCST